MEGIGYPNPKKKTGRGVERPGTPVRGQFEAGVASCGRLKSLGIGHQVQRCFVCGRAERYAREAFELCDGDREGGCTGAACTMQRGSLAWSEDGGEGQTGGRGARVGVGEQGGDV